MKKKYKHYAEPKLTKRRQKCFDLHQQGMAIANIAATLNVSKKTVQGHVLLAKRALGMAAPMRTREDLVRERLRTIDLYEQGLSSREVAAVVGKTVLSVNTVLRRAGFSPLKPRVVGGELQSSSSPMEFLDLPIRYQDCDVGSDRSHIVSIRVVDGW